MRIERRLRARRAMVTVVAAALAAALGGCGVVWDAPEARLVVSQTGVSFAASADRAVLEGGETFLELVNNTDRKRRMVLARVDEEGELPPELLEAEFPHEDDRIVDMTSDMRGKRASLVNALQYEYAIETFHIHLHPNRVYVLFDTYDDDDAVPPLWFVPKPGGIDA